MSKVRDSLSKITKERFFVFLLASCAICQFLIIQYLFNKVKAYVLKIMLHKKEGDVMTSTLMNKKFISLIFINCPSRISSKITFASLENSYIHFLQAPQGVQIGILGE